MDAVVLSDVRARYQSGFSPHAPDIIDQNGSGTLAECGEKQSSGTCKIIIRASKHHNYIYCFCFNCWQMFLKMYLCLPVSLNPSCLHTTLASGAFQKSSQTVPHPSLLQTSTRPSYWFLPPTSLMSPSVHSTTYTPTHKLIIESAKKGKKF